ncbi:hypothetical protein Bpfe_024165 [Biomphalaria pfeifferi]|uniref:Uncharacterized protein n=1 Tax=Biomphalaria pfeifferi TaxID=112525 RepID=A0AAD8B1J0_BIOPF|nr:hypothetical protein Bpfe_024165 [Biomphalaria pfeifferi]
MNNKANDERIEKRLQTQCREDNPDINPTQPSYHKINENKHSKQGPERQDQYTLLHYKNDHSSPMLTFQTIYKVLH